MSFLVLTMSVILKTKELFGFSLSSTLATVAIDCVSSDLWSFHIVLPNFHGESWNLWLLKVALVSYRTHTLVAIVLALFLHFSIIQILVQDPLIATWSVESSLDLFGVHHLLLGQSLDWLVRQFYRHYQYRLLNHLYQYLNLIFWTSSYLSLKN